jgi:hypothetical protein
VRSPSSLIFLVLLGVWAAYFLQYWIRRRDHLATARTVEQLSDAMRVLETRGALPRADRADATARASSLHPGAGPRRRISAPVAAPDPTEPPRWATAAQAPAPAGRVPAPVAPPIPRRVRPGRRVRAALLLVALVELAVIGVLVPMGMLPAWALAPAGVALLGAFAYVRAGVRAERALREARRRRRAGEARRRAAAAPAAAGSRSARPARARQPETVVTAASVAEVAVSTETNGVVGTSDSLDEAASTEMEGDLAAESAVGAVASVASEPAAAVGARGVGEPEAEPEVRDGPLVDEDDIPLTWDPVPVPRPTYTMKARVERPEVTPAAVTPDPEPVALPADPSYDERRVAGA